MKNNNIAELLEKAMELQEESEGIFIVYIKPRNKNKVIEYDTDHAAFDISENKVMFDFLDGTYKDFSINISNIKDIKFEQYDDDMVISIICLKNGNTIMIHSFTK